MFGVVLEHHSVQVVRVAFRVLDELHGEIIAGPEEEYLGDVCLQDAGPIDFVRFLRQINFLGAHVDRTRGTGIEVDRDFGFDSDEHTELLLLDPGDRFSDVSLYFEDVLVVRLRLHLGIIQGSPPPLSEAGKDSLLLLYPGLSKQFRY